MNYLKETTDHYHGKPNLRERLQKEPIENMSDLELLMLILGNGTRHHNLQDLARKTLNYLDEHMQSGIIPDLQPIPGVGSAKGGKIRAALEFSRRRYRPALESITTPEGAYQALRHLYRKDKEIFISMTLNGAHEIINVHIISIGILNRALIHPREFFYPALEDKAAAVIAAHNHPSGNLEPSPEDKDVTQRLKKASQLLGIPLLDHLIFTYNGFVSFQELGLL